jgi:hypothetical protein
MCDRCASAHGDTQVTRDVGYAHDEYLLTRVPVCVISAHQRTARIQMTRDVGTVNQISITLTRSA